ncbi:MAG: DNA-directed DNA polymerase II small subunit [Sulfurovaceae bacterium]|nr:DNA-directed DNA polymerase II small subunit [Sulfurovaceae bacterium]
MAGADNYKKKIVGFFLDNKIFLSPETLNLLEEIDLLKFYSFLQIKKEEIISLNPKDIIQHYYDYESQQKFLKKPHKKTINSVKVIKSYEEDSKKRKVQDFVNLFNDRYNFLSNLIQSRPEMKNTISIRRLKDKKQKEEVTIIGMVRERRKTKSGHLMFVVEDTFSKVNVLVSKNRQDIFQFANTIMEDEVIGIKGSNAENIIFANQIIIPDIPVKEAKKSEDEVYAIFLGDMHTGSKYFLDKEFNKFIDWVSGKGGSEKQKEVASKVKYIFIVGDIVAGVGIYPNQENNLVINDLNKQCEKVAEYLKRIPTHIKIIISTGNHDPAHLAEPQPPLYFEFAKSLYDLPNVLMVGNPALINIHQSENFPGFNVLMYHGYSFDYFISNIDEIRMNGGYDRADLVMKYLLQRRHLAPTFTSTPYIPTKEDNLLIKQVPDFFVSGHLHRCYISSYKNVTMICASCWESITDFQIKLGHNPEPARVPIVNLQTRAMKILKF